MTKFTAIVDGATIHAGSAEDAAAIQEWADKVTAQIANDNAAAAARQAELAAKDQEIADKRAQLEQLRQQQADQASLVIQLGDLKHLCRERLKVDPVGRTIVDMKRDAIGKLIGQDAIAGKDAAYIEARFDMMMDAAAMAAPHTDPFRDALNGGLRTEPIPGTQAAADLAWQRSVEALNRRDN